MFFIYLICYININLIFNLYNVLFIHRVIHQACSYYTFFDNIIIQYLVFEFSKYTKRSYFQILKFFILVQLLIIYQLILQDILTYQNKNSNKPFLNYLTMCVNDNKLEIMSL